MLERYFISALVLSLLTLTFAGCYSVPFEKPVMPPLGGDVDPAAVAARFDEQIPTTFETENTLVFQIFWKEIAALGYANVNRKEQTFEILCLNHLGVQLFHISGDADGNHLRYALPEIEKHPEFVDAVGKDIRHIYFDLIPAADAVAEVRRDRVIYRHYKPEGSTEYTFGGPHMILLKKRVFSRHGLTRVILFYEYKRSGDHVFPGGIVLHNPIRHYRLVIKTRKAGLDGRPEIKYDHDSPEPVQKQVKKREQN